MADNLEVHVEFLGLYHVPSIDAHTLTTVAKDTLVRMNLPLYMGNVMMGLALCEESDLGYHKNL